MAHKFVTFERGWEASRRLYVAECVEPGCGAIVAGCPSRTAAREALTGHENAPARSSNSGEGNDPTTQQETGSEISPMFADTSATVDLTPAHPAPANHPVPAWATEVSAWEPDAGATWERSCETSAGPVKLAQAQIATPDGVRHEPLEVFIPEQVIAGEPLHVAAELAALISEATAVRERLVSAGTRTVQAPKATLPPVEVRWLAADQWSARAVEIDSEGFVDVRTDEPLSPQVARELAAALILAAGNAEAASQEV